MGTYLKAFSERVADVPSYLKRHLALIRDLDEKVHALHKEIELQSRKRLAERKLEGPAGPAKRPRVTEQAYDVDSAVTRLLSLADEKVNIAAQVYDFIDKHVQHLDEDLRSLGVEVEKEKAASKVADGPSQPGLPEQRRTLGTTRKKTVAFANTSPLKSGPDCLLMPPAKETKSMKQSKQTGSKPSKKAGRQMPDVANMPPAAFVSGDATPGAAAAAVQEEPLYCYCHKPSHGNMIACDNDECAIEWFHYECVGLIEGPPADQKWYCPDCNPIMMAKDGNGMASLKRLRGGSFS